MKVLITKVLRSTSRAARAVFQKLAQEICLLRLTCPTAMSLEAFKEAHLPTGPKSEAPVAVGDAVKEMVATVLSKEGRTEGLSCASQDQTMASTVLYVP